MRSISVLGCGWLGLPLAEALVTVGYQVKGSTRTPEKIDFLSERNIDAYLLDLENISDSILSFLHSDILIIAVTHKKKEAFECLKTYIERSTIKTVIFISSTSVYQNCNQSVAEDSVAVNPDSPHIAIETLFRQAASFNSTILRLSGLIGPKRHPGRFFARGNTIRNPDACVNLVHLFDCVEVIIKIIKHDVWGETFNICSDHHPTKRNFYTRAALAAGLGTPKCDETTASEYKLILNDKVKKYLDIDFLHSDLSQNDFFQSCE